MPQRTQRHLALEPARARRRLLPDRSRWGTDDGVQLDAQRAKPIEVLWRIDAVSRERRERHGVSSCGLLDVPENYRRLGRTGINAWQHRRDRENPHVVSFSHA